MFDFKAGGSYLRGYHDLGGMPADRVEPVEHDYALWERRVDALLVLMASKGHIKLDEHRRNRESLGDTRYAQLTYYEKWIAALAHLLIEKGLIHIDELRQKLVEVEERRKAEDGQEPTRP